MRDRAKPLVIQQESLVEMMRVLRANDSRAGLSMLAVLLELARSPVRSTRELASRAGLTLPAARRVVYACTPRWSRAEQRLVEPRLWLITRVGGAGSRGRLLRLSTNGWRLLESCGVASRAERGYADADRDQDGLPAEAAA